MEPPSIRVFPSRSVEASLLLLWRGQEFNACLSFRHPLLSLVRSRLFQQHSKQKTGNQRRGANEQAGPVPPSALADRGVQPHSHLVEYESRTPSVKKRNPESRLWPFEDQCEVARNNQHEDAVRVVMDVDPTDAVVEVGLGVTDPTGQYDGQTERKRYAPNRVGRFKPINHIAAEYYK